jgi:GWxTD domain-containing protein
MSVKRTILLLTLCLIQAVTAGFLDSACGQEPAADQNTSFKFSLDYTRFRFSEEKTCFEFYASFYRNYLNYVPEGNRFRGEFLVTASVLAKDSLVATKSWKNVNMADSLSEIIPGQRLFCQNDFVLDNGRYTLAVKLSDVNNPSLAAELSLEIDAPGFSKTELQISDIQLAGYIQRDTTQGYLVKNGYRITPNPTGIYGLGMPMLYLYSEIYNLAPATSDSGGYYHAGYRILNADGRMVKEMEPRIRKKPGNSAVEISGINVVTLVSGAYQLLLEVVDRESGVIARSGRRFFVYREADFAEGGAAFQKKEEVKGEGSAGIDADRYNMMTEKEVDDEFENTRFISTKEERDTYKKLNLQGKQSFIKEFWAKRDQTLGTAENEFKRDYLGRVEFANQTFKGGFRNGWRSDRGRIVLIYGRPDEIERFPFSNQNRTYEIWHYYSQQGGLQFYFVDKRDTGDLELVHSTARGELYDPEWERWIDPNR